MRSLVSSLALAAVAAVAAPALAGDVIVTINDRTLPPGASIPPKAEDFEKSDYTITEWNVDQIHYKLKGLSQAQSQDADKVKAIHFDPANLPRDLALGERLVDSGQYAEARAALAGVGKDPRAQKWARDQAAFLIAESYFHEGDLAKAIEHYQAFLENHGKSRYLGRATSALARAQMQTGDVKGARSTFTKLKGMADIPAADQLEADFGIIWIDHQVAKSKNDKEGLKKAAKDYADLERRVKGRAGVEALVGKCIVGRCDCQIALGEHDAVIGTAAKLVAANKDPLVRAGAYTLLGRALWKKHSGGSDQAALARARDAFLKVVTLYGPEPGAEDYMAEALFSAGALFIELMPTSTATDEDKAAVKMARMRAIREWRECVQRFPRSGWAARAQQRIAAGK